MTLHPRILSWALIFILCLRFPPGKSLVNNLKECYHNGSLHAFRLFQKLELKLGKAKLDLLLLLSCKKRNVIIKFLWFKVANRNLKNSSAYRACQRKLLDEEVAQKRSIIRSLSAQASTAYSILST